MTHEPGTAARPARRVLLVALSLLLAAALALLVVRTLQQRDVETPAGGGYGTAAERSRIDEVAEQFALNVGTYGPVDLKDGTMPAYRKRVGTLLTTKFRATFEEQVKAVEAIVAQAKLQVKAKVNAVGVASVDDDRATAFVAWETTGRYGKGGYGEPRQTRSKVTLVRVKGEWRVDDFTPVTGEATK
jgi:Mce-associated membrane protein